MRYPWQSGVSKSKSRQTRDLRRIPAVAVRAVGVLAASVAVALQLLLIWSASSGHDVPGRLAQAGSLVSLIAIAGCCVLSHRARRHRRAARGLVAGFAAREDRRSENTSLRGLLTELGEQIDQRENAWLASQRELLRRAEEQRIALDRARQTGESSERAKREFLACASHELKTPISGILGYCSLLLETRPTDEQRQLVDGIDSSTHALLAGVDKILDYVEVASDEHRGEAMELEPRTLLTSVTERFAGEAADKGLTLRSSIAGNVPPKIRQDARLLRQALGHLVDNAIKFTPGGDVTIFVTALPLDGDWIRRRLRFAVRDTGIGVRSNDLDRIFDPLTQADSSNSRSYEGLGLGLAISRRIAERLGGTLEVDSTPGAGSCFRFDIPIEGAASAVGLPSTELADSPPGDAPDSRSKASRQGERSASPGWPGAMLPRIEPEESGTISCA